ncbi:MAG: hypothetical protein HY332_09755 [Chloroflexi bacterium]|nr:hypothetical protein [Chloroflexota bacterium]
MGFKDRAAKWWVWSALVAGVAGVVVMATASAGCGVRIRTSGTETAPATAAAARGASVQAGQAGNPVVQAVAVVPAPGPGQQKVVLENLGMT